MPKRNPPWTRPRMACRPNQYRVTIYGSGRHCRGQLRHWGPRGHWGLPQTAWSPDLTTFLPTSRLQSDGGQRLQSDAGQRLRSDVGQLGRPCNLTTYTDVATTCSHPEVSSATNVNTWVLSCFHRARSARTFTEETSTASYHCQPRHKAYALPGIKGPLRFSTRRGRKRFEPIQQQVLYLPHFHTAPNLCWLKALNTKGLV
jgi:hypothetical protein